MSASPPTRLSLSALHQVQRHAPFDSMTREHLHFLVSHLRLAYFAKGEVILTPEPGEVDTLFIIRQGVVIREEHASLAPDPTTVQHLWEGECFPLPELAARQPVTTPFRAVSDVFVLMLNGEAFRALLAESPAFHAFCTRPLTHLMEIAQRQSQSDCFFSCHGPPAMNTPLRDVSGPLPCTCTLSTPVAEALADLQRHGDDGLVVVDEQGLIQGVFTLRDMLERVTLAGRDLATPMAAVMTPNPVCLSGEALVQEAVLAMVEKGISRVLVTDHGRLTGVVSEQEIFPLQQAGLSQLHRAIRTAADPARLRQTSRDITRLTKILLTQGVGEEVLARVITTLHQHLACRIIHIEHQHALQRGEFSPDIRFCWLSMGSEGRQELSLRGDQDNGIIFQAPPGLDPRLVRDQLADMALRINNHLDYCGIPLCQGKFMACNPKWRLPLLDWQEMFHAWIDHGDPNALLNATILFDFRPLYGEFGLADILRQWLTEAGVNRRFLHQMTANALRNHPPLGLFQDFKLNSHGGVDLKLHGVMPFVDAARIFALASRVPHTSTVLRLQEAAAGIKLEAADVEAWSQAFQYLQLLRLRMHLQRVDQGLPLSHDIQPQQLNSLEHRILKEVFRQARRLQSRLAMEFQR